MPPLLLRLLLARFEMTVYSGLARTCTYMSIHEKYEIMNNISQFVNALYVCYITTGY
jgi:hypothetical protein